MNRILGYLAEAPSVIIVGLDTRACHAIVDECRRHGAETVCVTTGEAARRYLEAGKFDAIIADVDLPDIGLLQEAVRRWTPRTTVCFLRRGDDPDSVIPSLSRTISREDRMSFHRTIRNASEALQACQAVTGRSPV